MMNRNSASRQSAKTSVSSPSAARIALKGVSTFARTIDAVERLVAGGAGGPRSARRRLASASVRPVVLTIVEATAVDLRDAASAG